jgi:hypothetical protein
MVRFSLHIFILLLLQSSIVYAQNESIFFKVYPVDIDATTPEWAVKMYGTDPMVPEVDYLYKKYWKDQPFVKDIHVRNYLYWRKKVENWVDQDGKIRKPDPMLENAQYQQLISSAKHVRGGNEDAGLYKASPVETYAEGGALPISWQVNVYCLDVAKGDKNTMIAGTEAGGVFISNNAGLHWRNIGENANFNTVEALCFHPLSDSIIFLGGNRRIFKSDDQGARWTELHFINGDIHKLFVHPVITDRVFAATSIGLFQSEDGGNTWVQLFSETIWDLAMHPVSPNILYMLKSTSDKKRCLFYRNESSGAGVWQVLDTGWYMPENAAHARDFGGKIGVSKADPDRVYAALIGESKPGDAGWIGVYRSQDKGETWILPSGQIGGPYLAPNTMPYNLAAYSDGYHQGFYNFALGVSSLNADRIWVGTIRLNESNNGGRTFESIGAADARRHRYIHADIQDMLVIDDEIWVASDGGIDYSSDELQTHVSRKYGIHGADYWGFDRGWNKPSWVGGKYHNGNGAYLLTYPPYHYLHIGGVEEPTGYVNPLDNQIMYTNQWWAGNTRVQRIPDDFSGKIASLPSLPIVPNESYVESSSSGIYFHPQYAAKMYIGKDNALWFSDNAGVSFDNLASFGSGEVFQLAICHSQPDIMYVVFHLEGFWSPCEIYRTENGGKDWVRLSDIPANRWRLEIQVDPSNPMHIWVGALHGANNNKLFQSLDGGRTWINRSTTALNDQQVRSIAIYPAGNSENDFMIHVGTNRAMFTAHMKSDVFSGWSLESSPSAPPVPNAGTLRILPYYPPATLDCPCPDEATAGFFDQIGKRPHVLCATRGRGVYIMPLEADDLRPVLQIVTPSDVIGCARDTVPLATHAIMDNRNIRELRWGINPAPVYISDSSIYNPRVVFGESGKYDITLSLISTSGEVYSKTFPSFISVENQCDTEPGPGNAVSMENNGDFVQIDDLGIRSNTFTISAWVYPEGIQPEYSAIFMNDDQTAGLNFRPGNNALGYHWPGGAWWWDSGLQVPAGQWSQVALVAEPDGITVYVNGVGSKHRFNVPEVVFGTAKVGSYKGWNGRNMSGKIDELSIWNRSLSEEELRLSKHLTRDTGENGLVAYYQFNESGRQIFNKVGNTHGIASGNADRVLSFAPVAAGSSIRISQHQAQVWSSDSLGVSFFAGQYQANSSEWYVFRMDNIALKEPGRSDDELSQIWILNTYGEDPMPVDSCFIAFHQSGASQEPLLYRPIYTEDATWAPWGSAQADSLLFLQQSAPLLPAMYLLQYRSKETTRLVNKVTQDHVVLYPNPTNSGDVLTVEFPKPESGRLKLMDSNGRILKVISFEDSLKVQFTCANLSPGSYLIWYETSQKMGRVKFVVGK